MVGHTGVMSAAVEAVHDTDVAVDRILAAVEKVDGVALITADHGNAELMFDSTTGQPHTAHTTNPVPLILVDPHKRFGTLRNGGSLQNVAPTILAILGIEQPKEMTGESLLERYSSSPSVTRSDPRTDHRPTHGNPHLARAHALRPRHRSRRAAGAAAAGDGRSRHAALPRAGQGAEAEAARARRDDGQRPQAADVRPVGDDRGRRLPQLSIRPRRLHGRAHPQRDGAWGRPASASSSSTRTSIRTRPRTSATSATPFSATPTSAA